MCQLAFEIPQWFPWNGSKRWLVKHIAPIMQSWAGDGVYFDPFVGGGSISALVRGMFPDARQHLSDANPWVMSAFQSQLLDDREVVGNYTDTEYWRNLKDADLDNLSVLEKANRFAICLFTAWGNRWKSKSDGSMGTENPINKKFIKPEYLKKRLAAFFSVKWLEVGDTVVHADWKETVKFAKEGDLVYIDPPYPESLGYGNQWWSFSDQLDVVDWVADAVKRNISVVVSNMATIERLYRRAGLKTMIVDGPKTSKTRTSRSELLAWQIGKTCCK
jgi:DNA adenine methylase